MRTTVPSGMTRRHFLTHLAGASTLVAPALMLGSTLRVHAHDLQRRGKSAILLWMGGGPSTIDLWDLKPGAPTGGPFRPISTSGDVQICEHLPLLAQQMHHFAVIRSMSTREADHERGRYYMHTGYVPNPNIEHPSYGAVLAHELAPQRQDLEIPPFVTVGGSSVGPGFLGMAWAPFAVSSDGQVRDLSSGLGEDRLYQRMIALDAIENQFIAQQRGTVATDHQKVLKKTLALMTSAQMTAFQVNQEPEPVRQQYGNNDFGRSCLMARRLVEQGVPFVEVDFGGWDNHQNIFPTLKDQRLPTLDRAMSALVVDLEQRGLLADTAIIWMGEFGRTPRINGDAGRDHWARAWSVVLGGAGIRGGIAVGQTNEDGTRALGDTYAAEDLLATVCRALGISLETTFTSRDGRPMKIANSGKVIDAVLA
ncbi:MAG: DUF1501 domain-containing protein [Pirellulaceae bacterium]|jgi:uncharacterized protein (DUF1501 family)|nr:DUF1501 domain-containing protein [Pirellulaceae bacterium]